MPKTSTRGFNPDRLAGTRRLAPVVRQIVEAAPESAPRLTASVAAREDETISAVERRVAWQVESLRRDGTLAGEKASALMSLSKGQVATGPGAIQVPAVGVSRHLPPHPLKPAPRPATPMQKAASLSPSRLPESRNQRVRTTGPVLLAAALVAMSATLFLVAVAPISRGQAAALPAAVATIDPEPSVAQQAEEIVPEPVVASVPFCAPGERATLDKSFAALKEHFGHLMGEPAECAHRDPDSGDLHQHTTTGLAVVAAPTGIPRFTDGWRSWALTPRGPIQWEG